MRVKRMSVVLCMLVAAVLFSGCGDQGWVRVSPDGQYVTVVRKPPDAPADSNDLELALYHIDRRQTTPIVRFLDKNSPYAGWVYNCQWTPDSRAVCFTRLHPEESPEAEATPSENGENSPAETAQTSNPKYSLVLYEVASGRLMELPIAVEAPRWSADGRYLIGIGEEDTLHIYRTDSWVCAQRLPIPEDYYDNAVTWDWAHWLQSDPPRVVIHLGAAEFLDTKSWWGPQVRRGNLYLLRSAQLIPLTTTGDVQAFWVDKTGVVLRWARVQSGKFLAVFERPLQGGAPRRVALVPYATIPEDAQVYGETFYRFSPDGQRLAWWTDYGVSVLEIATGVIRTLHAHKPKAADKTSTDGESWIFMFELKEPSIIGFDWRDAETLVIQGDLGHLELHSVRTFYP
jgi:hypothetical protein